MTRFFSCCIALLLIAAPAAAQWTTEYDIENDVSWYAAHMVTSTVGYVSGASGLIYKTTDGGYTWVEQTTPTTEEYFDIFFLDVNTGWAVGDNGTLCYTTDGGANWNTHPQQGVIATADLNDVFFLDSMHGWIGGDAGVILLTTDGGTTWVAATSQTSTDDVNEIGFFDALRGCTASDSDGLMYTTDGGVNWLAATVSFGPYPYTRNDVEAVWVIDDSTAVATGWGSSIGPQPTILVVSTDYGQSWNIPDPTYAYGTYTYGYSIIDFDDGEVLVMGGGTASASIALFSTDNGATWDRHPAFWGEEVRDCSAFPGTDRVVAVGDEGLFVLSEDRGATWEHLYRPGLGFGGILTFAEWGKTIIGAGDNGNYLYKDMDTGETGLGCVAPENWAADIQDVAIIRTFGSGVYYPTIYACGSNGYLCKAEGDPGVNGWTELQHTVSNFDAFYGQHWFDPLNGVLVGEQDSEDAIWTTDDGGVTLNRVHWNVSSTQLNACSFAPDNPLVGVALGDDIAAFYTTDGGATWTAGTVDLGTSSSDIEDVHMTTATTGFAVGDGGMILKTTNGGVNWVSQTSPASVTIYDVYFSEPNFGWLAVDNGAVYYTDDGGATWNNIALPTVLDANEAYLQKSTGLLFVGCDDGHVYSRDDAATGNDTPVSLPFVLQQNFPNPFNPATTISFSINRDDRVSLNVYDVAGRLVATVLDKEMKAGDYNVSFRANGLASGVYFYKLKTSANEMTRKMILLR